MAAGQDLAARRFGLCPGRTDDVVRGERRRLRLRAGSQPAPGRRHRRRARCRGSRESGPGRSGTALRRLGWQTLDSWSRERRVVAKAEHLPKGANPVSSSPRSRPTRSMRAPSTRSSTAPAARSKTGSRSSSSTCSPIAPLRRPCGPTSCGCGSRPSPTSCSMRCAGSALRHTQFAVATCGTIRLKLLKIGAQVRSQRAPDQDRHGLGLPVPDRVPPRLSLLAARRCLLSDPA